jgi:hypothetical protein
MLLSEGLAALAEKTKGVEDKMREYAAEEAAKREALKAKWQAEYSEAEQKWNESVAKVDDDMKAWWSGIQETYEAHKAEQEAKWDAWKAERDLTLAERNAEAAEADAVAAIAYARLVAEEAQAMTAEAMSARAHMDALKAE